MKPILFISAILLMSAPVLAASDNQSAATEQDAVKETVRAYFEITRALDIEKFRKIVHPQARWFHAQGPVLCQGSPAETEEKMRELLKARSSMDLVEVPPAGPLTEKIAALDIAGDIAWVKVELDSDLARNTLHISLIKLNSEWKIISTLVCVELKRR